MRILVQSLSAILLILLLFSCNDEDVGPPVEARITADSLVAPGDTVWLYATESTGYDSVRWTINIQPGEQDTIADRYNDTAYLIPAMNGLYNIKLTAIRGEDKATAFHDVRVTGPNILSGRISNDTTLLDVAAGEAADYLVRGILIIDAELGFDVQTIIEVESDGAIVVSEKGRILANNVTFKAADDSWRGVQLLSTGNVLVSCFFYDGGSAPVVLEEERANLLLSGSAEASLASNTFANSNGYGLVVEENARLVYNESELAHAFVNNRFESNASGPMLIPASALENLSAPDLSKETEGTYIELYRSEYGSDIEGDPTLADVDFPYLVKDILTIRKNMVILKGAEVYFEEDAGLDFYGNLQLNGTSTDPVVLDSRNGTPGGWKGILVRTGNAGITSARIRNGGGGLLPDVTERASLVVGGKLTMKDSEVSGSGGIGLWMKDKGTILYDTDFSGNSFSGNSTAHIRLGVDAVHKVITGNTLTPVSDSVPLVEIRSGSTDFLSNWKDLTSGIDYRIIDSVVIRKTKELTIDPGVWIECAAGSGFHILGSVDIPGTGSKPVRFSGKISNPGYWHGITISTDQYADMEHVFITDGGGAAADKANLVVTPAAVSISITNTGISNSAGYGVLIKQGASDFGINDPASGNTLEGTLGGFKDENK